MPKRKANWWPPSILSDPDVLSVDDEGRFVLCKICHVHYAVHGGKKPKPVIMNSNFRTRAWDVHKERTNSHRLQKQQERLQESKQQTTASGQEQSRQLKRSTPQSSLLNQPMLATPTLPLVHPEEQQGTQQTPLQSQEQSQPQHQELQTKDTTLEPAQSNAMERPARPSSVAITTVVAARSVPINLHSDLVTINDKSPSTMAHRRRVIRTGSPSSSRLLLTESETARQIIADERHSFMTPSTARKATGMRDQALTTEQAESSARWHHMHDDVSRALNAAPRKRQAESISYTSGELRAAKTLMQTETGDLGGNNSERVAKKLRSLNAEYHAINMRHADAYNMRHIDLFDRRSAGYKEYWGTLRDVYSASGAKKGVEARSSFRKTHHRPLTSEESKETEMDSTTPDDSGSSEDAFKPTLIVHDAFLLKAIKGLTDATSKLFKKEAAGTKAALVGLNAVLTELRVQHGNAFERIIELQEKHLKVMENLLAIKLRKEVARSARDGSTNGSSSECSPGSTNETSTT